MTRKTKTGAAVRPILFSTAMVRAILDGRKTQTRRVVKEKTLIHLRQDGCFVIFTAIKEITDEQLNFKRNPNFTESGLQSWERWEDLFAHEIQRIWQEGVRGLVSIDWSPSKKGVLNCLLVSRGEESYKSGSQVDMYGVPRSSPNGGSASSTSRWQSGKQQTRELGLGDTSRQLARAEISRKRDGRGEAPLEQTDRHGEGAYTLGGGKRYSFTKAHCADVGYVTIRYSQRLQYEVGSVLWCRETWALSTPYGPESYYYAYKVSDIAGLIKASSRYDYESPDVWRPSIHMPFDACRIFLRIKSVRVERLQEISEEDAIAEGLTTTLREHDAVCHLHDQWRDLWQSINGAESWDANPWVWVLEFERITKEEAGL